MTPVKICKGRGVIKGCARSLFLKDYSRGSAVCKDCVAAEHRRKKIEDPEWDPL